MRKWSDFHSDPRKSYYLFLRQGYACPAHEAHARVKWVEAMVTSLEPSAPGPTEAGRVAPLNRLRRAVSACRVSVQRVCGGVSTSDAVHRSKARRGLSS